MFVSYEIDVNKISKVSLNLIISFVDIPCFHSIKIFLYSLKDIIEKIQHIILVDQEMVTINNKKVLFHMHFLD